MSYIETLFDLSKIPGRSNNETQAAAEQVENENEGGLFTLEDLNKR